MTEVEYVACIICGKTVVLNKFPTGPFTIDPLDYRILQVRRQRGGRSKVKGEQPGFFLVPEDCKTIVELWNGDATEREIVEVFKERLLALLKAYKKAGIISEEDLK